MKAKQRQDVWSEIVGKKNYVLPFHGKSWSIQPNYSIKSSEERENSLSPNPSLKTKDKVHYYFNSIERRKWEGDRVATVWHGAINLPVSVVRQKWTQMDHSH